MFDNALMEIDFFFDAKAIVRVRETLNTRCSFHFLLRRMTHCHYCDEVRVKKKKHFFCCCLRAISKIIQHVSDGKMVFVTRVVCGTQSRKPKRLLRSRSSA